MPTCEAAIDQMAQDVDDPGTYGNVTIEIRDPSATELAEWCGPRTIDVEIGGGSGGPAGAFYYAPAARRRLGGDPIQQHVVSLMSIPDCRSRRLGGDRSGVAGRHRPRTA